MRTVRTVSTSAALLTLALFVVASAYAYGRTPKPAFATPGKAIYCNVDATTYDDPSPRLLCWRPRDGRAVEINWRGRSGVTDTYDLIPVVEGQYRILKGFRPAARTLRYGQKWAYRCPEPGGSFECPAGREGTIAFTCTSRRTGLTCVNAVKHGFRINLRAHRFF